MWNPERSEGLCQLRVANTELGLEHLRPVAISTLLSSGCDMRGKKGPKENS